MLALKRLGFIAAAFCWMVPALAAQDAPSTYRQQEAGVVAPVIIKQVKARYTDEARKKKIQGVVELETVVLEDGTVGNVRVTKSLDQTYGLDAAAVAALRQWLFKPGERNGKPVRVMVTVEISFTLR